MLFINHCDNEVFVFLCLMSAFTALQSVFCLLKRHIKQLAMALSVATLAGCGGSATETKIDTIDPSEPTSDWGMVWEDDFNGDSIDKN